MPRTNDARLEAIDRSLIRLEKWLGRVQGDLDLVTKALQAVAEGATAREHITRPIPVGPVRLVGKACYPRPGPR